MLCLIVEVETINPRPSSVQYIKLVRLCLTLYLYPAHFNLYSSSEILWFKVVATSYSHQTVALRISYNFHCIKERIPMIVLYNRCAY
jgi:hypothetical protein